MSFVKVPNILFDFYEIKKQGPEDSRKKTVKIKYYNLEPMDYRVYIYLLACDGFKDQSTMKLKYKTIAAGCNVNDPKTVRASLNRLASQGLLAKQRRFNRWGHNAANGYQLATLPGGYFMFDTGYFNTGLSASDTCVLLYLLKCKGKDQLSFPSVSTIAYVVNLSKVTVRKSLTWLSQRLFIRRHHYICKCGDYGNNHYRVYSHSEQFELLSPYRKIKAKAPKIFLKVRQQISRILHASAMPVLSHFFFKLRVGKISPNTS